MNGGDNLTPEINEFKNFRLRSIKEKVDIKWKYQRIMFIAIFVACGCSKKSWSGNLEHPLSYPRQIKKGDQNKRRVIIWKSVSDIPVENGRFNKKDVYA